MARKSVSGRRILEIGQKVGLEVGFPLPLPVQDKLLPDLLFDLFGEFPRNLLSSYLWATWFFRGFPLLLLTGPSRDNLPEHGLQT